MDLDQHLSNMAQADVEINGKRKREDESDYSCGDDDDSNDSDVPLRSGFKSKKVVKRIDGCNITFKRKDGTYIWKSEKFPNFLYYMDLKIWSPAKRAKGEPLEAWKEAVFRAKLAFGNPLEKQSKENANDFVRSLLKYVVT